MSHRGQSHLKTITRARPVSLKPPIQHLLCIGALKGACTRRLFNSLFFGTSTSLIQIVRRQCCLPIISKGGQVDSMHKSSPLARCSISWRQILCCYLGGSPPHPTSILGRPGAYVSCQSLVQVALDQCTCTGDTSLFVSTLPGLPISITLYNLAV